MVKSAGFTLIEVAMVIAATSILIPLIFLGQGTARSRAQFTASAEKLKANLVGLRNEANSTINTAGGGNTPGTVIFGTLACFTPGVSSYGVHTLTQPLGSGAAPSISSTRTETIPNGTVPDWTPATQRRAVVFARDQNTGRLVVFSGTDSTNSDCRDALGVLTIANIDLPIKSPGGQRATLRVEAANNSINLVYN